MIRSDFPILRPGFHYLDSAATTLKPRVVVDAELSYYTEYSANVHRGLYPIAERATQAYEGARDKVATFLGTISQSIVFTKSATHASNMLATALEPLISKKSSIITCVAEHHSSFLPWRHLSKKRNIPFHVLPISEAGMIEITKIDELGIDPKEHSIWMFNQISNVTGVCQDLPHVLRTIRAIFPKAIVIIDACQSVSHIPVRVTDIDCDALFFSGHKVFGPTGVGVLWLQEELHDRLAIPEYGGEMVEAVVDHTPLVQKMPHRLEAGTPPIAQAIGLGTALEWLSKQDFSKIQKHNEYLAKELVRELSTIRSIRVLFPHAAHDSGIITCHTTDVHPHDIAADLGSKDIAVRAGYQCAQPLHEYLNIGATFRISPHLYNTVDDIRAALTALEEAVALYRR
ncbi:MAG: putative cysteine desulfurase [Microgenomates bacterium OLB22]|nr:MAG: putative cysteine desulfurase [Microgenomates bacterium OLB22]